MYCPNTNCSGKLCLHKKTFQSRGKSDYQCPDVGLCARCAIFLLKIKQIPFFVAWPRGSRFRKSPKSVQDVIGDVYCPGKYCSNKEECEYLSGYVTTPRSIYDCGKCGAWLFVHKVPFTLQEHVTTKKNRQNTPFFA